MDTASDVDMYGPKYPLTKRIERGQKVRTCLYCGQKFLSQSSGHRICGWCTAYLHQVEGEEDPNEQHVRVTVRGRFDGFSSFLATGERTTEGELDTELNSPGWLVVDDD